MSSRICSSVRCEANPSASGAVPQSKSGYIADYVAKNYPQDPPSFPPTLAAFARAYQQWINQGDQLEKLTGQEQEAVQLVAMARANTLDPDAANGGMQTTDTGWSVAYSGFPDNNTIIASLKDTSRTVRVQISLEQANGAGLRLSVDNKALGALPRTDLKLTVGTGAQTQPDLSSADKVEMEIVYSGITVIRADPVEISANLKTGWYSRRVLQELKKKTGQDVTGLQLNGSTFSVDDLFGPGKSFARVRTFVISQEPTVRMTIEGAGAASLAQTLSNQTAAQLSLDDILSIGSSRSDYSVLNVQTAQDRVIVDLGPPPTTGTVPFVDQTAHIIGGVINFPP